MNFFNKDGISNLGIGYQSIINEIEDYAIFLIDNDGIIQTWNKGACLIKQYEAEEVIGHFFGKLFLEKEQEKGKPYEELAIARESGVFKDESWRRKKDGSYFWAGVTLTAIRDDSGKPAGFIKVTKDLTERKQAEDAIFLKNEQLTRANNDLDSFIYTASHDLKAPVANIEALISHLEYGMQKEEFLKTKEMLELCKLKFKKTIEELTNITKTQQEWNDMNYELLDLKEVISDVKHNLSFELKDACPNIKLQLEVKKIYFSPVNLRSIIYNLISNALKYRSLERDCNVSVCSTEDDKYAIITVTDNGIGMKEGYKDKLFRMFRRLHDHVEGTGVGLYLLKRIVENAGGKVEVESTYNVGSEFKVYLPKK